MRLRGHVSVPLGGVMAALPLILCLACTASGQEPGVTVDPDSPAGKEYAVPLDQARRQGSGSAEESANPRRSTSPPLFGVGITPAGRKRGGSEAPKQENPVTPNQPGSGGEANSRPTRARSTATATANDGLGPGLETMGLAGAVLLIGGGVALVLRRINRGAHE